MSEATQLVVVVRHGETEWSATGRHTGATDIALTERGQRHARATGAWLAHTTFDRVWTSPLRRARDTCALAGFGGPAEVDGDLAEWDYGDYEGLTRAEIVTRDPHWLVWTHGAPGGESPAQVERRTDRVVSRLLAAPGRTLIFAHGHLLRALAARWIELPVSEGRRVLLDTAAVGELGWYHGRRALARWNLTPAV
ncbi:MAG TPA: histidine phosphatase family protein [Euzebyales bacterium]|nr:histidine phosphatase family protein [Euzebyales bacterium]